MEHDQVSRPERVRNVLLTHHTSDLLYGAVVAGSVLAVSSAHAEDTAHVAAAAFVVTAIYWLAHVYVDAIGERFRDNERPMHRQIVDAMRKAVEVLVGALPPIAVFLLSRLLGADVQAAAQAALWFTVGLLVVVGALVAYLAGVRGVGLVVEALISGSFGLMVILLKYLLH